MTEERLQKYLARSGVSSRRGAEDMIGAGRVKVNGDVVREMGVKVRESDRIEVDGKAVEPERVTWIMLHKPAGYVTSRDDPGGRPTVYDLLPAELHTLFHVGRLDLDSEGLLLLTNEGDVANRLMHPSHEVDRVYVIDVVGVPGRDTLRRLKLGIELDDGPARVHAVEVITTEAARGGPGAAAHARLRVTMREGRKREVRRLFDAVEHPVRRLARTQLGPVTLGDLPEGKWRELTPEEVARLRGDG